MTDNRNFVPITKKDALRFALAITIICPASVRSEPVKLPPINVVGLGEVSSSEGLVPAARLRREEFEERPSRRRLGDVINRMPGVFMGGPPGENKDIRLRGLDKEFTRFELDGVQLPGGGEKREFQVNRLSPFAVQEIRILRQPTAAEESDGIAGRVQAELRPIPDALRTDFRLFGGRAEEGDGRGLYGASIAVGDRNDSAGGQLFLDLQRSPLHKEKTKRKIDAGGTLKETEREDEDKPTDSVNVQGELAAYYDRGSLRFKPLYLYLDEDKDKIKDKLKADGSLKERETETEEKIQKTAGGRLENRHVFSNGLVLDSDVGYYETTEDKDKLKAKLEADGALKERELEDEEKEDAFWMARGELMVPLGHGAENAENRIQVGGAARYRERFRDKVKTKVKKDGSRENATEPKDNYHLDAEYLAGFVQGTYRLAPRWLASAGVRYERMERTGRAGTGVEDEAVFEDVNPNIHLRYRASEALTLFGSTSRTLNRPKFDELAPFEDERDDRIVRGNPDLEPATSWNVDLGFEWQSTHGETVVTLFHKEISDVIEEADTGVDRDGKDVLQVQNVGDGRLRGVELEQRLRGGLFSPRLAGLEVWGNISVFDSELTDSTGETRPFNEQPDYVVNAGASYRLGATGTLFSVAVQGIGELEKAKVNEEETESSRTSLDLSIQQPLPALGPGWRVSLDALNLTDSEKEKTKRKFDGGGLLKEVEEEEETTGRVFMITLEGRF